MSTLPEDVQALHDRWLTDKLADAEADEGLGGPDGNLYYADDDDFWRDFDGLREAVYVEAEHPRDRLGRWVPKFVLSPIGLPGSGKGTIGKLLAEHYGVPHVSTGEMLRALPRDSDLGRQLFPLIEQGKLAPSHLVVELVADRLTQPDVRDGVVLDGSPRTQLEKEMLEQIGFPITYLELAVDRDVAVERLLKRAEIEGRADDSPDVIANRFRVHDAEIEPMIERLRAEGEMVTVQVSEAEPNVNAARAKKALAATKLAESYIESEHPRDERGRWIEVPDFIRSIIPDAHIVGGAVRDKLLGKVPKDYDFLAPGYDHETLVEKLAPHGSVEELIVDERKVGVRFFPNDPAVPTPPEGIEIAPPRTERSTGKGRHDFEIVADATVPPEQDMERRDFTVNAIAEAPDGSLVDPLGGAKDASNKVLRVVGDTAFRDDGLRIIRGLRFISQHDLTPDEGTLEQMRTWARRIRDVSGERQRIEFHKLLMGDDPAKALRIGRDTGVLAEMFPEFAPMLGFEQQSKYHGLTADEHTFETVQAAADAGAPLPVRIAAFWHDSGKPESAWMGEDGRLHYYAKEELGKRAHEEVAVDLFAQAAERLAYPNALRDQVRGIIAAHMFRDHSVPDAKRARKFRAKHGDLLADWLIQHKRADMGGKENDDDEAMNDELERLDQFKEFVEQERDAPVFLRDLAVGGNDLIEWGFAPGPGLGAALEALRTHVIGDPRLNTREWLEGEARRLLKRQGEIPLSEAYIERLHPRDRLGKWIDVPDFRSLGTGAPPTFRTPTMKPSTKRGRVGRRVTPRGWKERVTELRHVPVLEQHGLLERRRAAMDVKQPPEYEPPEEPKFAAGTAWYARKLTRADMNTRQMTRSEAERFLAQPEEEWPYAVFDRANEVTVAYYGDPADAEERVRELNERDLELEAEYQPRREEAARKRAEQESAYAAAQEFIDEWFGAPGRPGRYQRLSGDPGVAFEEQHERIMEAGALIDAEVRRRGKESEKRLADLVKRHKTKKAEAKRLAAEEERLAWEETARVLHDQYGWVDVHSDDERPPRPEDMKRRYQSYHRERNKRRPDPLVMSANQDVDDAWTLRYENPDGRVQAAHDAWVEAMWSRTEGNEGVDVLADQVHQLRRELHWTRRSNTYEVLEEIRPFASEGDLDHIRDLNNGDPDSDRRLDHATSWLPSDWIMSSNAHQTTLAVGSVLDRGKYIHAYIGDVRPGGRNISLILGSPSPEGRGVDQGVGTMLHELVHRAEYTHDGIRGAEWTFYASRVSPGFGRKWEEPQPLNDLTGGWFSYEDHERARPDKFTDFYSGKTYGDNPDSSYEILTMGIEDLVTGEHGVVMDDDEYRQFVLGAMALL